MGALPDSSRLARIPLFDGLKPAELACLSSLLHCKTFPADTNILSAEQPGELVYVILQGTVKIHVEQADGSDVILAILGPGEVLGEMSLLDVPVRSASGITLEESSLLWMDRSGFQECVQATPCVALNLARILSARLRLANERIQALSALDVYGRVARQILAFADRYGESTPAGDVTIPLRLTQSDIAALVGASRERVNQVLGFYKRQGYISVDKGFHITVHNRQGLESRFRY